MEHVSGVGTGARSPQPVSYYVHHAFKLEEPPPAHAPLCDDEYRRADDRLDRPTVVSMGS